MAEIVIVDSVESAGEVAADAVQRLVAEREDAVLGLATGSTPVPLYRALERRVAAGGLDLSRLRGFALDEYVGLPEGHEESYASVIRREVVEPLRLDPRLVHVPDGRPQEIETAGARYEAQLEEAGGIDLQILGLGTDGHIGFNEPGSSFASLTRVKTLTEQTRRDNARFFASPREVPMHCITQGVGTILRARHLLLLAFGEGKAEALAAAVEGPLTASVPGSAIQLHARVTVVVDEAAASRLARADYYRYAWANKPSWQAV
ncbi:glucosamine-6-phosphate deaminase [Agreia sp. PsM10]|uniref:glucosamine-6-phosphate deaminase n=1 Tax=Agreia sp. PsM10 TaxID=3030533 RepID=UPI00263BCBEA|nr:glucosamine-6-phosphate deaminase [Agreia sp. PsM10]MDN4641167.1 glucosamine-6-phosphate deaminase [Agreia sp. PsM10]